MHLESFTGIALQNLKCLRHTSPFMLPWDVIQDISVDKSGCVPKHVIVPNIE